MKQKIKKQFLFPAVLLIYVAIMAYMSYPRYKESGNWNEFLTITGISLLLVVLLFFILKRKQQIRDRFTRKD
ncbi:MAG: LPXTG cell wall anchor domain-containing protein [Porphyromonadaceae bacterium]|nr:LPXTG cell wall anchor domain-containing protein [Porphyromonadaceae bacterium]